MDLWQGRGPFISGMVAGMRLICYDVMIMDVEIMDVES